MKNKMDKPINLGSAFRCMLEKNNKPTRNLSKNIAKRYSKDKDG